MGISAAKIIELTDLVGAGYLALAGSSGSGFGCGNAAATLAADWGFSKAARQFQAAVMATQDFDIVKVLGDATSEVVRQAPVQNIAASLFMPQLSRLDLVCATSGLLGVSNLETFALYYNTGAGGPDNCRLAPAFGQVWQLAFKAPLNPDVFYSAGSPPGGRTDQPPVSGISL